MGSGMQNMLGTLLIIAGGITVFVLLLVFVAVPLFKGIGMVIGGIFRAIGWFFAHIFEFIIGMLGDVIRFIGALLAMVVLIPLVPLNIVIGRWSAAGHFAEGVKRECQVGAACVYRAVIRRPLKLVLLHGLLEGLEQRVPEAMHGAPTSDKPSRRTGQFDGYTILGSLRAGGSGAKLYVAEPVREKQKKFRNMPDRVVIKSFALTEGSSLPQIVRESRALECAKQLGHVLDHGMDEHRFFYVMPYHPGDHLGILTRQLHGECSGNGLDQKHLTMVMSYTHDLLATLSAYHKGGLWHKDVKPENVIVHDGEAHLVDLGLVTPLRSAMTLTTHGTEYFRDPEMVRQALRGVKVHQVDGAKFDIYAVGAVLYFMIENTFPAHGGLSRFVTNSPEALRWIVRRAMTEYNQRYETADEMLADLDYVAAARDAFAVKPAELPSMRGAGVVQDSACTPEVHVVNATGMNDAETMDALKQGKAKAVAFKPSNVRDMKGFAGIAFGPVGIGMIRNNQNDNAGSPAPEATAAPADAANPSGKPKLTVTNWWTGEYKVDDAGDGSNASPFAGFSMDPKTLRQQAFAFRDQARQISRQARVGAMGARKAAREQLKAARQRAREMRANAMAHRRKTVSRSNTSPWAVALGSMSLLIVTGLVALAFLVSHASSRLENSFTRASSTPPGQPVLLALDASNPADPRVVSMLKDIIAKQRRQGHEIIIDPQAQQAILLPLVRQWMTDRTGPADGEIEDTLAARNAYGILYVKTVEDKRKRVSKLTDQFIRSTRPNAESRIAQQAPEIPAAPALPYLLINDHPAKADPQVESAITQRLKFYYDKGWKLMTNDDLEVSVRKSLPTGPIDQSTAMPAMLYTTLSEAHFGGILRIDATKGGAPPQERIAVTIITLDHAPAPAPPAPASPDEPAPITVEQGQPQGAAMAGSSGR